VRIGIAHHLGWAVAVTASANHEVADRRRIELIEPGLPVAPIEHESQSLPDGAVQRRAPYASRADSVMYCQVLSECAHARGWEVHLFDAQAVEAQAARVLGARAHDVLHGPRATLGPPWTKDHRIALAATIVAG